MIAKTVMPDKFWILEDSSGSKKGTLRVTSDGQLNASIEGTIAIYPDWPSCIRELDLVDLIEKAPTMSEPLMEVNGFPTNCTPFNPIWDVKKKLPLFTKIEKSQSQHAAGYYIIKFEHGWVSSFCPKLSTLNANVWQGPFKTKIEMRERLRLADG